MLKSVVKAILFDLDGTLVDTIEDIRSAFNATLALENLSPLSTIQTKQVVGRGLYIALKGALDLYGHQVSDERFKELYQFMIDYYREHAVVQSRPYRGISSLLKRLSYAGIPMGVLSNKEDALTQRIVSEFFGSIPFIWVSGLKQHGTRKPDRLSLAPFCNKYGISSSEVLYIGDSEVDWQTACNAFCPHILVSWGFRTKEELQALSGSVVVDTVQELEEAINGIQREGSEEQS